MIICSKNKSSAGRCDSNPDPERDGVRDGVNTAVWAGVRVWGPTEVGFFVGADPGSDLGISLETPLIGSFVDLGPTIPADSVVLRPNP